MATETKELFFNEVKYVKRLFTDAEKVALTQDMFKAEANIAEKEAEVKTFQKSAQADIARYEAEIASYKEKIKPGYESIPVKCTLKYEDGFAIYLSKLGEIIEKRPMTDKEQLSLAGGFTDAEQIVRADSEKRMNDDVIASFGDVNLVKKIVDGKDEA